MSEDKRPDWVKAASYEMMFMRQEMDMAKAALSAATERLDNVNKWSLELAINLEKHVPKTDKK